MINDVVLEGIVVRTWKFAESAVPQSGNSNYEKPKFVAFVLEFGHSFSSHPGIHSPVLVGFPYFVMATRNIILSFIAGFPIWVEIFLVIPLPFITLPLSLGYHPL